MYFKYLYTAYECVFSPICIVNLVTLFIIRPGKSISARLDLEHRCMSTYCYMYIIMYMYVNNTVYVLNHKG